MFSEGGLKFFALEKNKNVCLAIYDPSPMHLIKITPKHIDFLHSVFREQGFNARQALDF